MAAVGVGQCEEAVAPVRGAKGCRWYAIPFRVIPALGQVPEYSFEPQAKVPCDVFQECECGSYVANDSVDFWPEVAFVVGSLSMSCGAEGLAWVPADKHVEPPELVSMEVLDVSDSWDVRPVLFKDFRCIIVNLHLPYARVACSFKAKVKSADTRE